MRGQGHKSCLGAEISDLLGGMVVHTRKFNTVISHLLDGAECGGKVGLGRVTDGINLHSYWE